MDPRSYKEADALLQGRNHQRRKLANNTWLERREDGSIAVRLHSTDVITYLPDGSTVYDSGGWRTVTTKDRINRFGRRGWCVWSDRGEWKIGRSSDRWGYDAESVRPYADGVRIGPRGGVYGDASAADLAERRELKAKIRAYAELCVKSVPLSMPSSGDCWYCSMQTDGGEALGDALKDTSHLISHMDEGYVVPSLVWRALEENGCRPERQVYHAIAFRDGLGAYGGSGARVIRASVVKHLARRFGLAMRGA